MTDLAEVFASMLAKQGENPLLEMLLAPAYAEVDCQSGHYTGWRFPFEGDPIQPKVPLYEGNQFYIKKKSPGGKSCLYA